VKKFWFKLLAAESLSLDNLNINILLYYFLLDLLE